MATNKRGDQQRRAGGMPPERDAPRAGWWPQGNAGNPAQLMAGMPGQAPASGAAHMTAGIPGLPPQPQMTGGAQAAPPYGTGSVKLPYGMRASEYHSQMMSEIDGLRNPSAQPSTYEQSSIVDEGEPPIGTEQVREAIQTLMEYQTGKAHLTHRVTENEQWYKMRTWDVVHKSKNPGDPEPTSAWLFNAIANKHADAMDNYPEPNVLPREQEDAPDAELLSSILPVVMEQNNYEQTYSDQWWRKLKTGTGVLGVFWSSTKNNGLGDIEIRSIDLASIFWEPGVMDIQKSRNIFLVALVDNDILEQQYPELRDKTSTAPVDINVYHYDETIDTSKKSAVIDWYYKTKQNGRDILHYCKFCGDVVLFATENERQYADRGFYDHGKYPFIFDTLFPEEGAPTGFGYVDICKSPQLYIDKLDQVILKNATMAARPRYFVKNDGKINEDEYSDWQKDFVHFSGSGSPEESLFPIKPPELPAASIDVRNQKIDELKETSGNRDFNQGGTASGVTAASAIAALQEVGSKLSRDMIKSSYRQYTEVCYFCIELMRQFYEERRMFRVVGKSGELKFAEFSNARIAAQPQEDPSGRDMGYRMPMFDITVKSQRASPFSTAAQNELAKEFYGLGFFLPNNADQALAALELMQFEGIDAVRERITKNGTMHDLLQWLIPTAVKLAAVVDGVNGTQISVQLATQLAPVLQQMGGGNAAGGGDILGGLMAGGAQNGAPGGGSGVLPGNSRVDKARARAASTSTPT